MVSFLDIYLSHWFVGEAVITAMSWQTLKEPWLSNKGRKPCWLWNNCWHSDEYILSLWVDKACLLRTNVGQLVNDMIPGESIMPYRDKFNDLGELICSMDPERVNVPSKNEQLSFHTRKIHPSSIVGSLGRFRWRSHWYLAICTRSPTCTFTFWLLFLCTELGKGP